MSAAQHAVEGGTARKVPVAQVQLEGDASNISGSPALTTLEAAMVGAEERAHVRRAILGAALRPDPSPHVFVEQVFSAPFYQKMLKLFPAADAFTPWQHTGTPPEFFGNYACRGQLVLPDATGRLAPGLPQFWNG